MNVLYLTNNPHLGSTARTLQDWLCLGRERGLRPLVVVRQAGALSAWLSEEGFEHLIDPMPWPDRRHPIRSLRSLSRVARWAWRRDVQIIHCNEHNLHPVGAALRRILRKPLVTHTRYLLEPSFSQWAFAGAEREPDALLWTSDRQRRDSQPAVDGVVEKDIQHLVPLGLSLPRFERAAATGPAMRASWELPAGSVVIGTASALRPRKRIHEFIEMIARLVAEHPSVVGVIAGAAVAGDEGYVEELHRQAAKAGVGKHLHWLGHLDDIRPFMGAIDVFVSTSEYETFGMSVLEAMAAGKAVAAYEGGSVGEVLGAAGLIYPTGDLEGLTAGVTRLVTDKHQRERLGGLARHRAATTFNPAHSLEKLIGLYRQLNPAIAADLTPGPGRRAA